MSIIDDISLDLHDARDSLVVSELALELGWESQERGPDTRAVRASWPPASNFVLELASDSRHMARARVQADELAGGTTSIETLGARAARAALQRVVGDVVAAARTHRVPKKLTPRVISALQPIVRDAILVAMLRGRDRARQLAKRKATNVLSLAVTSPYGQVLGVLAKQFDARVVKRLAKLADARALEVSTGLGKLVDQRVRDTLRELIAVGSTTGDAVKTLAQTMNGLGVTPSSPHALETMFRTQAQVAYGAGRWIADQDPDIQEILWGYTYVTVGDDRVREEHAALDGVTLPKDDPFWQRFFPPNGWNCRCQAIPVFDATGYREAPSETASGKLVLPDDGFDQNFGELLRADVGEDVIGLSQSLGTLVFGWEDQPRGADGKFGSGYRGA